MSVARGQEALEQPSAGRPALRPVPAPARPGECGPAPARPGDCGDQASGPAAWARALRLDLLPVSLLGAACGGLLVARTAGSRPGTAALVVLLVAVGHALAALLRGLGDARPAHAGPRSRRTAGRAVLALGGVALLLLGGLAAAVGAPAVGWALAGVAVVLVAVSRRAGPLLTTSAGLIAGAGTLLLVVQASLGRLPARSLPAAVATGAVVAAVLLARRYPLTPSGPVRLLAALPLLAAGAGVALRGLPLPTLGMALAVPAVRRAAQSPGTGLAPAARLCGVLLLAALVAAVVLPLPAA